MKFKDEIIKISKKLSGSAVTLTYGGGYFTGVKKIYLLQSDCICVLTSVSKITVYGQNLLLLKHIEDDLAFTGKVDLVKVEEV